MFSVVIIAYTGYVMSGGESSKFYLPYFETDLRLGSKSANQVFQI